MRNHNLTTAVIAVAFSLFSSCSSIRLRAEAPIQDESHGVGIVTFEKSYSTGSFSALCPLTAIFFGGACWFYLTMPTTKQKEQVIYDAESALINQGFELGSGQAFDVSSKGYRDDETYFDIFWNNSTTQQ